MLNTGDAVLASLAALVDAYARTVGHTAPTNGCECEACAGARVLAVARGD